MTAPAPTMAASPPGPGRARDVLAEHAVVTSNMGWRIMAMVVLVFLGVTITFLFDGHAVYGLLWAIATVGWSFFSFKLYRRHNSYVNSL